MVRECPKCGLISPPTAEQCDCGYEFATGRVTAPPVPRPPASAVPWLLAPVGLMVGTMLGGLASLVLHAPRGIGGFLLFLFIGTFWGAVLGGAAGVIAAVVIRRRQRSV